MLEGDLAAVRMESAGCLLGADFLALLWGASSSSAVDPYVQSSGPSISLSLNLSKKLKHHYLSLDGIWELFLLPGSPMESVSTLPSIPSCPGLEGFVLTESHTPTPRSLDFYSEICMEFLRQGIREGVLSRGMRGWKFNLLLDFKRRQRYRVGIGTPNLV